MKQYSVLILMLASILRGAAQLPQGAVAPDFSAQDIAGKNWQLYELLEQGKIVVLEIGATWCPPCWAYHKGYAVQDLWSAHGPDGDDKLRVFFVEGDPATNVACLLDEPGCNDFTPGNWTEGTTYPYIDNAAIVDSFDINLYPTILIICPNKKTYQVGQFSAEKLWEKAAGCPVASGSNNGGIFAFDTGSGLRDVCDTIEIAPSFSLINLGSNTLTAATATLQWNNVAVQTLQWNGNLPLYGEAVIAFDSLPLWEGGMLKTVLTTINGSPGDDDFGNNVHYEQFNPAPAFNKPKILLRLKTDDFGAETYWEIRDDRDSVLYRGGNQDVGPDGGGTYTSVLGGPGAYGDNVLINKTLTLPGDGCYTLLVTDAYGDGMCCDYGNGYFRLYNADNPVTPVLSGGEFEASVLRGFEVSSTTGTVALPETPAPVLHAYPNPASQVLHVAFSLPESADVHFNIADVHGRITYSGMEETLPPGEHLRSIPVHSWPVGVYILQMETGGQAITQKIVIASN